MLYRICLLVLLFSCWQAKAQEGEPGSGKGMSKKTGPNLKCFCRGLHLPEYAKGIKDYYFERSSPVKLDDYELTKVKGNRKKCSCFEYGDQQRKNVLYERGDRQQIDKYDDATDRPDGVGVGQVVYGRGYGYLTNGKSMYNSVTHRPFGVPINRQDVASGLKKETDFSYGDTVVSEKVSLKASDYPMREDEKFNTRRNGRRPIVEWYENYHGRSYPAIYGRISVDGKENLNDDENGWRKDRSGKMDKGEVMSRQKRDADFEAVKMKFNELRATSRLNETERKFDDFINGGVLKDMSRQSQPIFRQRRESELDKSYGDKMSLEGSTKGIVNSVVKQAETLAAFSKNKSAEVLEKIGFGLGMASEVLQQAGSQAGSLPMGGKMAQNVLNRVSGGMVIASNAANTMAEEKRSNGRRKRSVDTSDSETFDNSTKPRIAADNIIKMWKRSTQKRQQTTTRMMTALNPSSSSLTKSSAGLR